MPGVNVVSGASTNTNVVKELINNTGNSWNIFGFTLPIFDEMGINFEKNNQGNTSIDFSITKLLHFSDISPDSSIYRTIRIAIMLCMTKILSDNLVSKGWKNYSVLGKVALLGSSIILLNDLNYMIPADFRRDFSHLIQTGVLIGLGNFFYKYHLVRLEIYAKRHVFLEEYLAGVDIGKLDLKKLTDTIDFLDAERVKSYISSSRTKIRECRDKAINRKQELLKSESL